jgi:hypothetical protein
MQQYVAGTWTNPNPSLYKTFTFTPDGAFLRTSTNGVTEDAGTWRIEAKLLILKLAHTNYTTSHWSGKKLPLPLETRYHIIRADEHNLILGEAPPITLFGPDDQAYVSLTVAGGDETRFHR